MLLLMCLCVHLLAVGATIGAFSDCCVWHLAHCLAHSKCEANICCMSEGKSGKHNTIYKGSEATGGSVNEIYL